MIFTISFELIEETTLEELASAGFTIDQAEEYIKRAVIDTIGDELDESMTLNNVVVKYKED